MIIAVKSELHEYLRSSRDALLTKLDGISEYDARRPLTSTGTNLLGLVRHLTGVELDYFGTAFGRPCPDAPAWFATADWEGHPLLDSWVPAGESRASVVASYRIAAAHSDDTINALPLDAMGQVPRWPSEYADVTLHRMLVHAIVETARHVGHADILRESIDGTVGLYAPGDALPDGDRRFWSQHVTRVESAARTAGKASAAPGHGLS